jgi:hypothetical protein
MTPKREDIVELGLTGRWDEMKAIVDVDREGHEKTTPPSQLFVAHVESSTIMQKFLKKAKKQKMVEEKKEKIIEDLVLQKTPKPFNAVKCKLVDEAIREEYGNLFPFRNKPITKVKILVHRFFLAPKQIVYRLFRETRMK